MPKRLLLFVLALAIARGQAPPIPALVRTVREAAKPDQAMDDMRRIWETDHWFTFPKFEETARNVAAMMRRAGLENVEIVNPPADGVTQFGYWTMPLAWDVKQATLEIVEPQVSAEQRVLADYQKIPTSLGMWSGPTPPGGLTAEVIAASGPIDQLDVRGKFVLTDRNPAGIKWLLAKKGALGAINDFTENKDLVDGRQWINAWGDNGWAFTKGSVPLVCFSISPRQSALLRKLLQQGPPVRVRARVDSRYYAGVYPYTTGVIRGSEGSEEVLTLGHTSEQGAHDNATGVAAMIGAAETLNRLIAGGQLARPRRSIRVLAMGECYGSMPYLSANPERVKNTVAAMCVDTPAGPYSLAGTEYTWYLNPHPAKSYTDALIVRLAEEYFPLVTRPWHVKEYMSGTDNYLGDPLIGIPTVWPYSGTGVHSHHNSADTPDTVEPRSLRDLMVMNAVYLYSIASAGPAEARLMAELALTRGYQQIAAAAGDAIVAGRPLPDGAERVNYARDRAQQAVRSARRLAPIEDLSAPLAAFAEEQKQRLRRALPNAPGPPRPSDPETSRLIVRRKRIGTITLDDLAPDQREGYPAASFSGPPVTALYWCDGKRNLAEVIRLTELEIGPVKFDFVGYFKFLEKRGYVEFVR
ncbi:MAG: M28 family peptidase [Acidobacteria bacterium]|nr:M28 family peptidase [Acidobacteriota bacterium]